MKSIHNILVIPYTDRQQTDKETAEKTVQSGTDNSYPVHFLCSLQITHGRLKSNKTRSPAVAEGPRERAAS